MYKHTHTSHTPHSLANWPCNSGSSYFYFYILYWNHTRTLSSVFNQMFIFICTFYQSLYYLYSQWHNVNIIYFFILCIINLHTSTYKIINNIGLAVQYTYGLRRLLYVRGRKTRVKYSQSRQIGTFPSPYLPSTTIEWERKNTSHLALLTLWPSPSASSLVVLWFQFPVSTSFITFFDTFYSHSTVITRYLSIIVIIWSSTFGT